jgi:glycosyltransferase involved in cell wall biosynthesis
MEDHICISVLMATYNTDFLLIKRAIDSVLRQDVQNFELIVIDDGSDFDRENRLVNYIQKNNAKVRYIYHSNCGQSESINRGLLLARGKYITFLDADDEYKSNHLSACLLEMGETDLIASTTQTIVDQETDYYVPDKSDPSQLIHVDDCILFATLFGRKEVFLQVKFQNMYAADARFYEIAQQNYRVRKVNLRTYVYYRNMPNSISARLKRDQNKTLS